ncbi:MAG: O-antigen ligase family protein [Phycisphaeraceae bacterium]|nr:O-antigen ligase family protein [Phycisphaeraceae bacterium]
MRWLTGVVVVGALLLSVALGTLGLAPFPATVSLDPQAIEHDDALAWRTRDRPLHGWFVSAVSEGEWSLWPVEATLLEDGRPLEPARSSHDEIRREGAGRWSLWLGQVYFSTGDESDPTSGLRAYLLSAPLRPTPLLLVLWGASLVAALLLLRRESSAIRRLSDPLISAVAPRPAASDPVAWSPAAPLLLAGAMALTFSGWYGAMRLLEWDVDRGPEQRAAILPYLSVVDFVLVALFVLTVIASRVRPSKVVTVVLLLITLCLAAAGIDRAGQLDWQPQITGVIAGLRFAFAFTAAWCLARAGGLRAITPTMIAMAAIWIPGVAIAAWRGTGQFIEVGGHFPSFAGMVLALLTIFALHRGALVPAVIPAVSILATGSRVSVIAWPIAVLAPVLRFGRSALPFLPGGPSASEVGERAPSRRAVIGAAGVLAFGVAVIFSSERLRSYLLSKLSSTTWLSMGRRLEMTGWTINTIQATGWSWFGWGCGRAPSFIQEGIRLGTMPSDWGNLHVIWLQWLVELGIFALPLIALVAISTVRAWVRAPLPAALWTYFLLSQSIDYWLWSRDGLLLWGVMLGVAEGMRRSTAPASATEST